MTIAHPAPQPTTRPERALELYRTRGHLIRSVAANTYEVPSSALQGRRYTVHYGGTAQERCGCPDWQYNSDRGPCKHLLMVGIAHAKRRSGVREARTGTAASGDPFKAAGSRRMRELADVVAHELDEATRERALGDLELLRLRGRVGR